MSKPKYECTFRKDLRILGNAISLIYYVRAIFGLLIVFCWRTLKARNKGTFRNMRSSFNRHSRSRWKVVFASTTSNDLNFE